MSLVCAPAPDVLAAPPDPDFARKNAAGNLTRCMVLVMPTLAAFGPLIPGVGPLYAFRVAALVLFVLARPSRPTEESPFRRRVYVVSALWIVVGLILTPFAIDRTAAFHEVLSVGYGIAFVCVVVRIFDRERTLRDLFIGWRAAFVLTGLVGTWEVLTGHHLAGYMQGQTLTVNQDASLIASTFTNPNGYALFLVAGCAPMFAWYLSAKRPLNRVVALAALAWWLGLILSTGSRMGLIATAISIVAALLMTPGRRVIRIVLVTGGLCAVLLLGAIPTSITEHLPGKVQNLSLSALRSSSDTQRESGGIRIQLIKDGWQMFVHSAGVGVGPGNFPAQMTQNYDTFITRNDVTPHNGAIELLSQYGLIVFAAMMVLFLTPIAWVRRQRRAGNEPDKFAALVVMTGAAIAVPISVTNSTLWVGPTTWITVAIYAAAALALESVRRSANRA